MGKEKIPYILIETERLNEYYRDPFITEVNNQILNIRQHQMPMTIIKNGMVLGVKYSDEIEKMLSELEGLKNQHIDLNYAVKEK